MAGSNPDNSEDSRSNNTYVRAMGSNPNSHTFVSAVSGNASGSGGRHTGGFGTMAQPLEGIEEEYKETERSFQSGEISRNSSKVSTNRRLDRKAEVRGSLNSK